MKDASHKRPHIIRFHLYELLRIATPLRQRVDQGLPGAGGEPRSDCSRGRSFNSDEENVLELDSDSCTNQWPH